MTSPESAQDYGTMTELLLHRANDDRPGLRFEADSWSWREVVQESAARAAMLLSVRSEGPLHIGVLLNNEPEYLFWLGAAALSGAVVVGINPTRRGQDLADDIARTDCQLLVTDAKGQDLLAHSRLALSGDRVLRVDADSYATTLAGFADVDPAELVSRERPGADQLFLLLFTSGTTGRPKAVRCTQGRLAQIAHFRLMIDPDFGPDDVALCMMPLFHGNALMLLWAPSVLVGAMVVVAGRFSASNFGAIARRYGVTRFNYVGKALAYILDTPALAEDGRTSLVRGFGTEGAVADRVVFERRFNCELVEGYGSSEGGAAITWVPGTPAGSLGKASDDVAVLDPVTLVECEPARFDDRGRILNSAEATGEIVNRSGSAGFEGYYKDVSAANERTRNGWYWTGDLAYRDADGFFYFAGRNGDWMRVDSENITAGPIERILLRNEDFAAAAVFGVPDPRTGDQVMAAVELRAGRTFDSSEFTAFLRAQSDLGDKSVPRFVRVANALPQTATGRLVKEPLKRAGWWATDDRIFWQPDTVFRSRAREGARYVPLGDADRAALRRELQQHDREHLIDT